MVYEGFEHYRMGLEVLGPYLAHVHLKNARWTETGARDGRQHRAGGRSSRRSPKARVDVRGAVRARSRAVGYDGWVSFEDFSTTRPLLDRTRDNLAVRAAADAPADEPALAPDSVRLDRRRDRRLAFFSRMTLRGRGPRVLLLLVVFMGSVSCGPGARRYGAMIWPRARSRLASRAEGGRRRRRTLRDRPRRARAARAGPRTDASTITEAEARGDAAADRAGDRGARLRRRRADPSAARSCSAATTCSTSDARRASSTARTLRRSTRSTSSKVQADLARNATVSPRGVEGASPTSSSRSSIPRRRRCRTSCSSPTGRARQLETQFAQEQQQQLRLLAAARQAEAAAAAATTTTQPAYSLTDDASRRVADDEAAVDTDDHPPTKPSTPPPPSGNRVCPVRGAVSFVDSWGAPRSGGRSHQGVDMMSARGTPNVAIVSGTITQKVGSLAGNGVYLSGDDGNSYWYFHLDRYEGGPRHVAQGEVVGYTGSSGNADGGATHTHFEYHPGHGGAANPYPIVRAVC